MCYHREMRSNSKLMVLITVIIMDLLSGMELDLFVPSFPELQQHFNLTPSWVEALLSVNFFGYCFSLLFLGDLSDRFGRKPIILFGLSTFVIGSIICVWPFNYEFLLLGRFLQGVGVAAPAILSFLIIADSYPLKDQQFINAMMNGSMNIAVGIAPVLGSYITLHFHWHGNFAALLILGLMVLVMTVCFIPNDRMHHPLESTSLRGLRSYIILFQSKPLLLLLINLLALFVPYWIFVGMSPMLYMKDLNVSLEHFGFYQGILAIVFAIGSVMYGVFYKHADVSQKGSLQFNNLLLIVSLIVLGFTTMINSTNPLLITVTILTFVIAQIIPSAILYPICLNLAPNAKGRISAIIQGSRLILTALALQIAGYFYSGSFQNIGIILICFIFTGLVTAYYVVNNNDIMKA